MADKNTVRLTFTGQSRDLEQKFDRVGRSSDGFSRKLKGVGLAAAGAALAVGAAAIAFGVDAVKSFMEAEKAQTELSDAFKRFPKLADTNIKKLQKLNTELAKKTRFDDDATASAQAVLAQYKLTGAQLETLTPLVQDYAAKTGRDLPEAASVLGKALLGKGRALADVGIKFKDTGTLAGNFDQIVAGLRVQVGGFAEKEGTTAAGKLEILKNRFGELKEAVGEKLLGVLVPASDKLFAFADEAAPRIKSFIDTELKDLSKALVDLKDNVLGGVKLGFDDIKISVDENAESWKSLGDSITTVVKVLSPALRWIAETLVPGVVNDLIQTVKWVLAIGNAFIWAMQKAAEFYEWILRHAQLPGMPALPAKPVLSKIPSGGVVSSGDRPPKFHAGGVVPGAPGSEMLTTLQAGERVTPAGRSGPMVLELRSSGARVDDLLVEILARAIKARGGNVQVALGR